MTCIRLSTRGRTRDTSGASSTEYGILAAGIAALVVGMIFVFGGFVGDTVGHNCSTINASTVANGGPSSSCS